jgi:hypothetical protein
LHKPFLYYLWHKLFFSHFREKVNPVNIIIGVVTTMTIEEMEQLIEALYDEIRELKEEIADYVYLYGSKDSRRD